MFIEPPQAGPAAAAVIRSVGERERRLETALSRRQGGPGESKGLQGADVLLPREAPDRCQA